VGRIRREGKLRRRKKRRRKVFVISACNFNSSKGRDSP
jgi:hypothetical protein